MRNNASIKASPKVGEPAQRARKPVNLSASAVLIDEARALGLNLSRLFEEALGERLRQARERRWQEENRPAIEAFGRYVERHGIFGDSEERGF